MILYVLLELIDYLGILDLFYLVGIEVYLSRESRFAAVVVTYSRNDDLFNVGNRENVVFNLLGINIFTVGENYEVLFSPGYGDLTLFAKWTENVHEVYIYRHYEYMQAVENEKDEAKKAIELIGDELGSFINAVDSFTNAVESTTELFKNIPWSSKAFLIMKDLAGVFGDISGAVSEIYDATLEIDESFAVPSAYSAYRPFM